MKLLATKCKGANETETNPLSWLQHCACTRDAVHTTRQLQWSFPRRNDGKPAGSVDRHLEMLHALHHLILHCEHADNHSNHLSRQNSIGSHQCLWPYLVWLWPWPLTFWPQNLISSSLSPHAQNL